MININTVYFIALSPYSNKVKIQTCTNVQIISYHINILKQFNNIYCSFHISLSKAFWRYLFHYFLFLAESFMMCVNVFYITKNEISVGSDKKWEIVPIVKIYRHDVTKVGDFYNGGLWGNFSCLCRIQLKFGFWLHKNRWHTSWKFKLEISSNKKVVTKKYLTNLYEMNSC